MSTSQQASSSRSQNQKNNAQLRRAAGSSSHDTLQRALNESSSSENDDRAWTASKIDAMASDDGKNALHMAAWTGCIENVKLLLDLGCHINAIATGPYSYGKTPIFFAATRSRDDIVTFLLQRGANVKIVNNKGQSVLSIASSHLQPHTIARIQQAEIDQSHLEWINYRATHSDNLEYGDLDPRFFFERPLKEHSDIVTPLAINPTTKQSRRGGFLRRNPHLLAALPPTINRSPSTRTKPQQPQQAQQPQQQLSVDEENTLSLAWKTLEGGGTLANTNALWTILDLSEKRRQPWIVNVAIQLRNIGGGSNDQCHELFRQAQIECDGGGEKDSRRRALLERLWVQTCGTAAGNGMGTAPAVVQDEIKPPVVVQPHGKRKLVFSTDWKEAYQHVSHLSISSLIRASDESLQLPEPPVWVDTIEQLNQLRHLVESVPLVAFDTEWASLSKSSSSEQPILSLPAGQRVAHVSTIQLSWNHQVWVVEALRGDAQYQMQCRSFVTELFQSSKLMLGFALGKDISMLEAWLDQSLDLSRVLDLQGWWIQTTTTTAATTTTTTNTVASRGDVPGLARCTREVVGSHHFLSKVEQRSNWDQRPLSTSQLVYAGMDAAILPTLLAERTRQLQQRVAAATTTPPSMQENGTAHVEGTKQFY